MVNNEVHDLIWQLSLTLTARNQTENSLKKLSLDKVSIVSEYSIAPK